MLNSIGAPIDADYPNSHGTTSAISSARQNRQTKGERAGLLPFVPVLPILAVAAWCWFGSVRQSGDAAMGMRPNVGLSAATDRAASPSFQCEAGKTHCSHMRSYDEALFYVRNCPNVSMDGDGDGEPCERQFGDDSSR